MSNREKVPVEATHLHPPQLHAVHFPLVPSTSFHSYTVGREEAGLHWYWSSDTAARLNCAVIALIRPQLRQVPFQPSVDLLLQLLHYVAPFIELPEHVGLHDIRNR